MHNEELFELTGFYQIWKRMGFPYGSWGYNPNRLVQIVNTLNHLDLIYNPTTNALK